MPLFAKLVKLCHSWLLSGFGFALWHTVPGSVGPWGTALYSLPRLRLEAGILIPALPALISPFEKADRNPANSPPIHTTPAPALFSAGGLFKYPDHPVWMFLWKGCRRKFKEDLKSFMRWALEDEEKGRFSCYSKIWHTCLIRFRIIRYMNS